jgi:hypothetical protein
LPKSLVHAEPEPSTADLIRRRRRALPPAEPPAGSWRAWAAAVCQAESEHARSDFWRVVLELGLAAAHDRDDGFGGHERPFLFRHEAHAQAALSWLAHLQAHESDRRGPWAAARWEKWDAARRRRWLARRRYLWAGFLGQMRRYAAARASPLRRDATLQVGRG